MSFIVATFLAIALVAVVNCGGSGKVPSEWKVESETWGAIPGTEDLAIGERRFAFVLTGEMGIIKLPVLDLDYQFIGERETWDESVQTQEALASFHQFPETERGLYAAELHFDRPGRWAVRAHVPSPSASPDPVVMSFNVSEETYSVDIGERPPASTNRTLNDKTTLSSLTTGSFYDEQLYQLTVKEAIETPRPLVVVFASPAFCTTPVCGPQVQAVSSLREKYGGMVDFIHIDIYENPEEIQGDISSGVRTPILEEWGITADEWTYVIGSDSLISASFENFAPEPVLEEAIKTTLERG